MTITCCAINPVTLLSTLFVKNLFDPTETSLKTSDINGQNLHSFIQDNFMGTQTKFKPGKNKISIHLNPQSLI